MNIKVKKLTDLNLLREANRFTTGNESQMSLATAYRLKHSPIRTQIFWLEMRDIPLFVASQLVRSHVGIQCYQLSKRTDRGGADFSEECDRLKSEVRELCDCEGFTELTNGEIRDKYDSLAYEVAALPKHFDRYAPTDLAMLINAEAIMNMSAKRLCMKASKETREIWQRTLELIEEIDPDLVKFCRKPCVITGVCREGKSCGFMATNEYIAQRKFYKLLFTDKF